MTAHVRPATVHGFQSLILENELISAELIPQLGGRVWELHDRRRSRQWIWQREEVSLRAMPLGACYDDSWAGGWEELFPNDAPGEFEGHALPDHGEWWSAAWNVAQITQGAEATVRLTTELRIRKAVCTKEYRLARDSDTLRVSYRIESMDAEPFHFLFKQHLPVALTPACEIVLPGGTVTAVDPSFGTMLPGPGPFAWPVAHSTNGTVDLGVVPPRSKHAREFIYVSERPDNWCGIDDRERGAALRMYSDNSALPFLWLFLTYGGWRNCYTAVLEPCTNLPKDLAEATRLGQSAQLTPGGVFETEVAVSLRGLETADRWQKSSR
ncbi:MAG: hypothetical protein ACREMA_06910 [Longimicrobiales bacterium]